MFKNSLIALSLVVSTSLFAQSDDTFSLVGFEGGYSNMKVQKETTSLPVKDINYNGGFAGVKIGAQSEDVRLFLSARYFALDKFSDTISYGAELQYLFNFSSFMNFYIGANGGMISTSFDPDGESSSRTISDPYMGGDAGFNIHIGEQIDIELGSRLMMIDAQNNKNNINYKFNNMMSGYFSVIYKYHMD